MENETSKEKLLSNCREVVVDPDFDRMFRWYGSNFAEFFRDAYKELATKNEELNRRSSRHVETHTS